MCPYIYSNTKPQDYEDLVNYAKKGIVADKEIYERLRNRYAKK